MWRGLPLAADRNAGTASEADAHERGIEPMDQRDVLEHLGTLSDRLADAGEARVRTDRAADFGYF